MKSNKNPIDIVNSVAFIQTTFGTDTFTNRDYNEKRPCDSARLNKLKERGLVRIVKVETFTKEVELSFWKQGDYIVNQQGEMIMEVDCYNNLSASIKNALIKTNNNQPFFIVHKTTHPITCKRYYYALDLEKCSNYLTIFCKEVDKQWNKAITCLQAIRNSN